MSSRHSSTASEVLEEFVSSRLQTASPRGLGTLEEEKEEEEEERKSSLTLLITSDDPLEFTVSPGALETLLKFVEVSLMGTDVLTLHSDVVLVFSCYLV